MNNMKPLSEEAREARKPAPPEELVGALQNPIHTDIGRSRPAYSYKMSNMNKDFNKRLKNTLVQIEGLYKEQRAIVRSAVQEFLIPHKEVTGIAIDLYEYQGLNMGSPKIIVNDDFITESCYGSITIEGIEYTTLDEFDFYSLVGEKEKTKQFYSPLHQIIYEDLQVLEAITYPTKDAFREIYEYDVTIIFTRDGETTEEYVYPY